MTFTPVGGLASQVLIAKTAGSTLGFTAVTSGDVVVASVLMWGTTTITPTSITGGGVSTWSTLATYTSVNGQNSNGAVYLGTVSTPGSTLATVATSANGGTYVFTVLQEFSATNGAELDVAGHVDTSGTNAFPVLTPAEAGELYFGYCLDTGDAIAGSTAGYTYKLDVYDNPVVYNANCTSVAQHPLIGDSGVFFGLAVLLKPSGTVANTGTASLTVSPSQVTQTALTHQGTAALTATPQLRAIPAGGTGAGIINQVVSGNVINDYGLDDVPMTLKSPGTGTMLAAFVGWNVATLAHQSSGRAPAVNVTDSAGNLWRQVGISASSPAARCALWVADNPRQLEWVSVALTGWGYSTGYTIVEIGGIPDSLGAVSLDFVSTTFSTAFTTSLTVPTGTATTSDLVLAVVATGASGGPLTIPTNFTGIAAVGGATQYDVTTYSMINPDMSAGSVTFAPGWANSAPSSAIVAGLKLSAPAPVQSNPNFPVVSVEAAFGASPGDWTQSVDYTWDITGLEWTDITTYCVGAGEQSRISAKRGRSYELTQEETGELNVTLDNHTGVFTFTNTESPFYPYLIPGTPLRVTAWWNGTQYPVAFGYAEKWPNDWPEMPQWGFSEVAATDAYGPMAATNLFSAVVGDVRKDYPYAYFPTEEQYEFTTQSLDPVQTPLDADGLIAVNYAFGNQRVGAYRDGYIQPVTVGQALNLMGDENTTLGATTYTGQETSDNGPGMFYFDPNIPTNANGASFSLEFWFVWGQTSAYSCTLFSAWGRPSSYFVQTTVPTNGGVITVGINTPTNGSTVTSGFFVNGVEVAQGNFDFNTAAPQHFALTYGSGGEGTHCYLNGVQLGTAPTLATIPTIRALSLGPARFSYDVSGLVVYNGYNYVAGHLAWYPQELTPTMISNHYESGLTGFVGDPAPGRYAQILTWGQLGLKRGGTAWYGTYGNFEGTFLSEAYQYDGSSAADLISQVTQTEGGRCFTQANGSVVYRYRWDLYNQPSQVSFGDSGQSQSFTVSTSYASTVTSGIILTGFAGNGSAPSYYTWASTAPASASSSWTLAGSNLQQGDMALTSVMSTLGSYTLRDNGFNAWELVGQASAGGINQFLYAATIYSAPTQLTITGTAASSVASAVYGLHNYSAVTGSITASGTGSSLTLATGNLPFGTTIAVLGAFSTAATSSPAGWATVGSISSGKLHDSLATLAFTGPELPFQNETNFAVDNQYIYNVINATQQRGPNQDLFVQNINFPSQWSFFMRSGLQYQSYAMLPFDVSDLVTWSIAKYAEPHERAVTITLDLAGLSASIPTMFPSVLGLELNDVITVTRRPIGGAAVTVTGVIQSVSHEVGPAFWKTTLIVTPLIPEGNALMADSPGSCSPGTQYLAW